MTTWPAGKSPRSTAERPELHNQVLLVIHPDGRDRAPRASIGSISGATGSLVTAQEYPCQ